MSILPMNGNVHPLFLGLLECYAGSISLGRFGGPRIKVTLYNIIATLLTQVMVIEQCMVEAKCGILLFQPLVCQVPSAVVTAFFHDPSSSSHLLFISFLAISQTLSSTSFTTGYIHSIVFTNAPLLTVFMPSACFSVLAYTAQKMPLSYTGVAVWDSGLGCLQNQTATHQSMRNQQTHQLSRPHVMNKTLILRCFHSNYHLHKTK